MNTHIMRQVKAIFEYRRAGRSLTFILSRKEYRIELFKVHEIIGLMRTTSVPNMPSFINGVINLRGKVIPVIGMR